MTVVAAAVNRVSQSENCMMSLGLEFEFGVEIEFCL